MRTRKPKLASGERVTVDVTGGAPGLGSHSGVVTTAANKEPLPRRALRNVIGFTAVAAFMIVATYVVLAITVFVVMRADGHPVAVLRNTFPVGQAPAGAVVYASSTPVDQSVMGKAGQAVFGVPAGSVVQVVAGPAATIATNQDGYIVADGTPTKFTGKVDRQTLTRQYVAICIAGACQTGEPVIFGQDSIVGEVKGYLGLGGITKVEAAQ